MNVAELVRVGSLELAAKNQSIVCSMYWSELKARRRNSWSFVGDHYSEQETLGGHSVEGSDITQAIRAAELALDAAPPNYDNFSRLTAWLKEHPDYKIRTIKNKCSDPKSINALKYPITTAIGPGARMTASVRGSELNQMLKELEMQRYLG